MRPVNAAHCVPLCAALPEAAPKEKEVHSRIRTCVTKALEWLRQHRHAILACAGLSLAITSTVAGQALTFLPLALIMIAFGVRGMIDQHLAKKTLRQGEERLANIQKNLATLKEKLPSVDQPLDSVEEIEAFADGIVTAAKNFQAQLKEHKAFDACSFKRSLENYCVSANCYKECLNKVKGDPNRHEHFNHLTNAYRNFARQFHAHIQHDAQDSLKRESNLVAILRKRAERA